MKITPLSLLLATTFLSTSAVAQTVPEINADYLNSLTGEKVTWEEVSTSGDDTVQIGDKYYKYTYHKPDNYTETSERINAPLPTTDVTNVVFKGISSTANDSIIYNDQNNIVIRADFIKNHGGFNIFNYMGLIENINGDFINNYSTGNGLITNYYGDIGNISGNFINNDNTNEEASYGIISNLGRNIHSISGNFIANTSLFGGAIVNINGTIGKIVNSNFVNNYAVANEAFGGAIASTSDLTIVADNGTSTFSGNKANGVSNAIFMMGEPTAGSTSLEPNSIGIQLKDTGYSSNGLINLNFEAVNGGTITVDDTIDGQYYNVNISGDVCENCFVNSVAFNNVVSGVQNLTLDTTQMVLGKNAEVYLSGNYTAKNNPILRVEVDLADNKAGFMEIMGNVYGKTSVIVDTKNYRDVRGEESIVFAGALGDVEYGKDAFSVARVVGSPYMWNVEYEEIQFLDADGTISKIWSLAMNNTENTYTEDCDPKPEPNPEPQPLGPIEVAPEVIATVAVKTAGLSQTNGMVYNIMRKVGVNRLFCPGCGFYDYNWDGEAFHNLWVDTTYNGLTIEAPVEIDANVWGIEAGSDLQHDLNNKLGIFVSYRQGNYEMDGKGEKYYSNIGSEIDIDSYLAGLYYRYDRNNWYAFATLYGGMQNAEIKTDDGVANYDTDGIEFGGSVEGGYNYALTRTLSVTPSLGVFYSQISYDDATDNVGKTVEYNDLKQVELEAGAKFAHTQYTDNGFYSLYIKPSVVQTLVDGDEIEVTKLGKVDAVEDKTLGRVELGGNYGFNDNWSTYGWANYTFGSDYEATSLGAGVNYAW